MNTALVIGAAGFGVAAMVLFWNQPLKNQLRVLLIALLVTGVMVATRLVLARSGVSAFEALTSPPYWKLIAAISAIAGILVSMLRRLLSKQARKKN